MSPTFSMVFEELEKWFGEMIFIPQKRNSVTGQIAVRKQGSLCHPFAPQGSAE